MGETSRLKSAIQVIVGGHIFAAGLATYWGNDTWYSKYVMPSIHCLLSPESAHRLAVKAAHYGLLPHMKCQVYPELKTNIWGLNFSSPVGLAAGFDKHGECVDGMLKIGFGFVEVGSITPRPQPGNPAPRVFRLPQDHGIINRYGFNSDGHTLVFDRLASRNNVELGSEVPDDRNMLNENLWSPWRPKFQGSRHKERGVVGVNLGKNKTSTADSVNDFVDGVKKFGPVADYLVINVSSPNTPGLRDLQRKQQLEKLVSKVVEARNGLPGRKPALLVKISPDLTDQEKKDIAAIVLKKQAGVDGLIVCNTSTCRPVTLKSPAKGEIGGLSGEPVRDLSTRTIRDMYQLTQGKVPIIGVGGISSGQDAYEKICAGASLVQIYTSLVYDGPPIVPRITRQLTDILKKEGFQNVADAVGADFKVKPS